MRQVVKRHNDPLTEPVFLILLSLVETPRHGYALKKDIEVISDGRVRLSTGTLYGALRRLLDDDWIERFEQEDNSRDKQAYRLTSLGRRQLHLELERIKQLTRAATARLSDARRYGAVESRRGLSHGVGVRRSVAVVPAPSTGTVRG